MLDEDGFDTQHRRDGIEGSLHGATAVGRREPRQVDGCQVVVGVLRDGDNLIRLVFDGVLHMGFR